MTLPAQAEESGLIFLQGRLLPNGAEAYQKYLAGTVPLLEKYEGTVSAVGKAVESKHTGSTWPINALLTFPSVEKAEGFLSDPDYLDIKTKYRDVAYETLHLTLVAGRPPRMGTAPSTREVAEAAFADFRQGLASGDWTAFLARLDKDITFHFPMGRFQGEHHGKAQATEFFHYVSSVFSEGLKVTDRVATTAEENRVVFEFDDEGSLRGQPYKNRVSITLEVCGEKICGYREYFGLVGPPPAEEG